MSPRQIAESIANNISKTALIESVSSFMLPWISEIT